MMNSEIDITFSGIIQFSEQYTLSLDVPAVFETPSGIKVTLKSGTENEIGVKMVIIASNLANAKSMAELEISRIANLLSWLRNIPIIDAKITTSNYLEVDGNKKSVFISETVSVSDSISIQLGLSKEGVEILTANLSKDYEADFEEVLIMWRDALKQESSGFKFFLLYRLLESLTGTERADADKWIRKKDSTLPLKKDRNGRNDISILTFLRDNVHAKSISFPFTEIEHFLPKLQELVKTCIEEKYGDNPFFIKEKVIV